MVGSLHLGSLSKGPLHTLRTDTRWACLTAIPATTPGGRNNRLNPELLLKLGEQGGERRNFVVILVGANTLTDVPGHPFELARPPLVERLVAINDDAPVLRQNSGDEPTICLCGEEPNPEAQCDVVRQQAHLVPMGRPLEHLDEQVVSIGV